MLRVLGSFGLGILFLTISAPLRGSLMDTVEAANHWAQDYSPLSYVGIGAAVLVGLMFFLYRAAQPRV